MPWPRRLAPACLLGVLAAALLAPSAAAGPRPTGPLVPEAGVLFGAWVNSSYPETRTIERKQEQIVELEAQIGRKFAIDHHYYSWERPFPTAMEHWDLANGRIPLVSWAGDRAFAPPDLILDGTYDEMIRERARAMRDLGAPIFLRWGWEMNGGWSGWGGLADPSQWPAKYVASWRHIHDIFEEEGATNVVWVWCPAERSSPGHGWTNRVVDYYPGDDYVDWVGIDGYNWGSPWRGVGTIFANVYDRYAHKKPIMIGETGSAEGVAGAKASWFADAQRTFRTRFPAVAAFVYFHSAPGVDWVVTSSPESLAAYRTMALDPYYNPGSDVERPAVTAVEPGPEATRVPRTARVNVATTEPLDCDWVSRATVRIAPAAPIAPTCSAGMAGISLNNRRLAPGTTYVVTLGGDLRDPAGNRLGQPVRWSFTTDGIPRLRVVSARVSIRRRSDSDVVVTRVWVQQPGPLRLSVVGPRGRQLRVARPLRSWRYGRTVSRRLAAPRMATFRLLVRHGAVRPHRRYRIVAVTGAWRNRQVVVVPFIRTR